jgi:WD40 repeat protein
MDGTVKCWDTNAASVATEFAFARSRVYAVAVSPCGPGAGAHALVAVGTESRNVSLCCLRTGGAAHLLMGHSASVWAAAWSPSDAFCLATGSRDGTVRVWDVRRAGGRACVATLDMRRTGRDDAPLPRPRSHDGPVTALRWSPTGRFLLSHGADSRLRLWNRAGFCLEPAHYQGTANRQQKGSGLAVAAPAGARGAAGDAVVFCPDGSDVRAFRLLSPEGGSGGAAFSACDGALSLSDAAVSASAARRRGGDLDGIGRARQRSVVDGPVTLRGHFAAANALAWRGSCQQLFSGGDDGMLLAWSAAPPRTNAVPGASKDAWTSSEEDGRA